MKIDGYIMSMADDVDCLPDALDSLAKFCDRIFVVDGMMGRGTLSHHPRYMQPIREWLVTRSEFDECMRPTWRGKSLTLYENEFLDPAHQRNYILGEMAKEVEQPDWIIWCDSDEVFSNEFIKNIRQHLETVPPNVTNITVKWLTLAQDEKHCVKHMSDWLAHSRIHRPNTVIWQGNWHEHGNFIGNREQWGSGRVIHTRALFSNRLKVQRGHDGIATGNTPLWANAEIVDIPEGITWATLNYPEGEVRPNSDNL